MSNQIQNPNVKMFSKMISYLVSERKLGIFSKIKSKIPDFEPDVPLLAGGKIAVLGRSLFILFPFCIFTSVGCV